MKKLFLFISLFLALGTASRAQTCATGYCPASITVHHVAGTVSPITADITYEVVKTTGVFDATTTPKCAIARNLGATTQATVATDATAASAGWYWQFNRKQGYSHDGTTRTPATTWITSISESSDWLPANDPCSLLLGSTWRLPTNAEWVYADGTYGNWTSYAGAYASALKLHLAGYLSSTDGTVIGRGTTSGSYWSGTQYNATNANYLYFGSGDAGTTNNFKAFGFSVRCLRTY